MASNQEIIEQLNKDLGIDKTKLDVGSITPITPYNLIEDNKNFRPNLTFGDPVINKFKKAFKFAGDIKEFILPTPKVTDPLSLLDYVTSSNPPVVAGKTAVKGLSKIDLDAEDLEELVEWVKSSRAKFQKDRVADILKRDTKGPGKDIKNVTQKYLKENNLVDKNGNVHLYRYLNIAESNKLKPDEGLSSLTLNPEHAKMMAYKQANVTGRKLKKGEKSSVFDDMDPTAASKYETVTMYRKPVVLEYKVPAEKIDAYLPAVFNSIDEAGTGFNDLARMNVENNYGHIIDDFIEDGIYDDIYDAADSLKYDYGLDDIYDVFDTANKESEALVDLTNIKPKNIYMDNLEIEQIANNPLIEKLEFVDGGSVNIEDMAKEPTNLQAALDMLTQSAPVTKAPPGTFDVGSIEPFNPLLERFEPNPLDDFLMMMAGPTSKARLAQLANPTNEVFATATRKEILDYIKTIPLKIRLALRVDDSIPLKGKYAILDSDKIDFYEDIVDLNKLPKNFRTGDNTLGKIYMEKNKIPSRIDMSDPLVGFKPRPYFEEIVDKKGVEKIKLYFPKTGRLEPYGAQTKYRQKTLTNPSKEELDKLFKGIKESDLKKQFDKLRKAEKLEFDPGSAEDLAEAAKIRQSIPYASSDEITKEILDLQEAKKLDLDLLEKLRKEFNL